MLSPIIILVLHFDLLLDLTFFFQYLLFLTLRFHFFFFDFFDIEFCHYFEKVILRMLPGKFFEKCKCI